MFVNFETRFNVTHALWYLMRHHTSETSCKASFVGNVSDNKEVREF